MHFVVIMKKKRRKKITGAVYYYSLTKNIMTVQEYFHAAKLSISYGLVFI